MQTGSRARKCLGKTYRTPRRHRSPAAAFMLPAALPAQNAGCWFNAPARLGPVSLTGQSQIRSVFRWEETRIRLIGLQENQTSINAHLALARKVCNKYLWSIPGQIWGVIQTRKNPKIDRKRLARFIRRSAISLIFCLVMKVLRRIVFLEANPCIWLCCREAVYNGIFPVGLSNSIFYQCFSFVYQPILISARHKQCILSLLTL